MKTLLSKGAYGRRHNRSPACVTKWIKRGKISTAALVGEGGGAKIWVERADADLAASLDPAQQLIQSMPILPSGGSIVPTADEPAERAATPSRPSSVATEREADLARRAKADADRAEQEAIAASRKNAVEEGRWIDAEEAQRVWGRELAGLIGETETFLLTALARALADKYGLDWKEVSVLVREVYRRYRMTAAEAAASRRESAEEMVQAYS